MAGPRLQHTSVTIPQGAQNTVRSFYGEILGLAEKQPPRSLAEYQVVWFAVGENEMELHFSPEGPLPSSDDRRHICLAVDDLAAYRARLSTAGVPIEEAAPIPARPRFFCRDPFGNFIEITQIEGDYRQFE